MVRLHHIQRDRLLARPACGVMGLHELRRSGAGSTRVSRVGRRTGSGTRVRRPIRCHGHPLRRRRAGHRRLQGRASTRGRGARAALQRALEVHRRSMAVRDAPQHSGRMTRHSSESIPSPPRVNELSALAKNASYVVCRQRSASSNNRIAPSLSSGSLKLPHLGDCTQEGHPAAQGHSRSACRVARRWRAPLAYARGAIPDPPG